MNLCKYGKFFKFYHKFWEIQFTRWKGENNYKVLCNLSSKHDHAGFKFSLDVWQLMFSFTIYDDRHWDSENDCWQGSNSLPKTEQNYNIPPIVNINSEEALKTEAN